jgi:hypothetical protein
MRPSLPLSRWFQYLINWFYKCEMHAVCTFLCVVVHMSNGKSLYWRNKHTSNQKVIKITSSYIHDVRQVKCHGLCCIAPPWKFRGCGPIITILWSPNIIWKRTDSTTDGTAEWAESVSCLMVGFRVSNIELSRSVASLLFRHNPAATARLCKYSGIYIGI